MFGLDNIPNVENSGSHDGFVYQDVVTGLQCRLHGTGGDAKGSHDCCLESKPN